MATFVENMAAENNVQFVGIDSLTKGYLLASLFDPFLICSPKKYIRICLGSLDGATLMREMKGISAQGPYGQQKEAVEFDSTRGGKRILYMSCLHLRLKVSSAWKILATCAELPAVVVKPRIAVFSFDPANLIDKYLNMMEPDITADITDLLIRAILTARGVGRELDDNDLRRDFHALGISTMMVEELCSLSGRQWDVKEILAVLEEAANEYMQDNFELCFK